MKPSLFIGSSSEGLPFAYALQENLEDDALVTVWKQDVFKVGQYNLESLMKQLDKTDFGVFVLSMDDVLRMRGEEHSAARDNVIFEFGLFLGKLGRENCVIAAAKGKGGHLPTDFLGLGVLSFDAERSDENWQASLGPASDKIRASLANVVPAAAKMPPELHLSIMERRDKLSDTQRRMLFKLDGLLPATSSDISGQFPEMIEPEIYYRMEHLRLLMFLTVAEGKFVFTDEYKRAEVRSQYLGRRLSPMYPPGMKKLKVPK